MFDDLRWRLAGKRAVILGVGNPLCGDDSAGTELAARLVGKINAIVFAAAEMPENYLGPVMAANPEILMIVDAANLGAPPGSLAIIEKDNIADSGISSHSASLNLFLLLLHSEIHPDTFILGIQPATLEFGARTSLPVQKTISAIEQVMLEIFPLTA